MGNRATPSRCCEPCRVKRRRCDFKTPECSQCQRARISCPGYKDAFTLRLRDETNSTARKIEFKQGRGARDCEKSHMEALAIEPHLNKGADNLEDSTCHDLSRLSLKYNSNGTRKGNDEKTYVETRLPFSDAIISPVPPDEAALSYFMHTYATHSSFFYFPKYYRKLENSPQDVQVKKTGAGKLDMAMVISVPALVLLSYEIKEPSLLTIARARYAIVLAATQNALACPQRAVLDSTLASVLLLGLVEALEFRGRRDPSWDAHALGAATLLEMRGAKQVESELGRMLYLHASVNIRRRCALRSIRMPQLLTQYLKLAMQHDEANTSSYASDLVFSRVSLILEDFVCLRVDIKKGAISRSDWIQRAVSLRNDLKSVTLAFQRAEPYHYVESATRTFATIPYGSTFHVYASPRMAKRWNDIRMLQIFVAELTRDAICASIIATSEHDDPLCTAPSPTTDDEACLLSKALQDARTASTEVLQSVPYMLHLSSAPQLMTSALLVLPLSSVALTEMGLHETREFARDKLRYIGDEIGNPQARESFHMVQESGQLERWSTITHCL